MDKDKELEIIEHTQEVVNQMKIDDIEDNPGSEFEEFVCDSCGEKKMMAGSLMYDSYILCNGCVLYAETAFALGKIDSVTQVVDAMEDRRLEDDCRFIIEDRIRTNN